MLNSVFSPLGMLEAQNSDGFKNPVKTITVEEASRGRPGYWPVIQTMASLEAQSVEGFCNENK